MHNESAIEDGQQTGQGKHLRDYIRIVLNRKWTILTAMVIISVAVTLSTFSKTPIYTARTQVLIEKNMDAGSMEGLRMYMMWDPDFRATQFQLIRSFNVAQRVVKDLQLDTKYRKYFFDYEPEHTSPLINFKKKAKATVKDTLSSLFPTLFQKTEKKGSSTIVPKSDFVSDNKTDAEKIAAMIQGGLDIIPIKDTKIVQIAYSNKTPGIAQMVVNGVVQAYIDETMEIKTSSARYTIHWMTTKAEEEKKKLEESERALQKYMRDHDIVTVENKLAIYPEKLSQFSSQLSEAQAKEKEYEAIYKQIEKAGKNYKTLEKIPIFSDNSVLQAIRSKIFDSEQNIKELSKKFGFKHPVIIKAKSERNLLVREKKLEMDRIIGAYKNAYELVKTNVRDLEQLMETAKAEMLNMNELFTQYTILNRDKEMNRTVYDALATSIKKTNVTAQSQDLKIWVVKKADLPGAPSRPNKKKEIVRGMLLGIAAGIALAFFLEYLDNTAKSAKELEERYGITVLGSVEDLSKRKEAIESSVIDNPLSPVAESYRLIRSGLLLSSPDHPPRTILVTSMLQQEGKTSTTANLGAILAQNDKKVLIIDCDMRRPRQHSLYGIVNSYGLSNYLSGNINDRQKLIQRDPNAVISLIPSGPNPPNPAELLSSKRMITLLQEAQNKYDYVLLDSPPIQQVTDSLMLGPLVDGTILVINAGKTTYEMLDNGIKKLREGHTKILGIVLNRLTKNKTGKGYYGYGYYSYYRKGDHYTDPIK
jgi:capsular exopolysaccharide synthesis family protein